MKEKDIHEEYENQQLIMYVEKEDGTYGAIQTGSYLTKHFLDDFWLKKINLEKQLSEKLCKNEISPIYYYMVLCELSEAELAARVGISIFRVKRHLQVKGFLKIKVNLLQRYAHVFNIPVSNLFQVIMYEDNNNIKSFYIKEKYPELFEIIQTKTSNSCIVKTTVKLKSK